MCTWNSNKQWLKQCLASIKREIPVCHLIVVDRFSDNITVEVVKEFFPKALIIESEANLGKARQKAIKHIDTEWFVFVDDDIELCNGWFSKITGKLTPNTGAIAGSALPTSKWLKKLLLYNDASGFGKLLPVIYMSNTLVRTNIVRDWSPPSFISSGEDLHLSQHIINKGYRIIRLKELHLKHHGQWGLSYAKKELWHSSGARLVGYPRLTTKTLTRKFFTSPLNGLLASLRLKEPYIMPYIIISEFHRLKGWMQWNKHRVLKR